METRSAFTRGSEPIEDKHDLAFLAASFGRIRRRC